MKNFSQNNQIPLSSSQNLSNIHRKIRKSIQLNQNNINPKQDPNIAQYHQKLVRKNTVNCTFELEKPKQPSITTTNNFQGGNQKNDGEEEIIIQTAGDLVAASTLKKKYAIKMKTYGQEFNEEIEFNEKARQQQVNLEDWENNQQSKKNEDEILKKKEQKLQQKELEEVNLPKINQAIIDSVLGKIENRVPNIKNIEDIEEQIQANHVLKPRTFNYTQQQMFEGETQLPSDIAEIILTHFYPNKKFEDMERVKRKTLRRIVKSMVSIRMEKVINKVGFQSINDQQTLFNIGKFVAISTLKNFSQLKATKIVDNIDYNYLGKKINDNQRQLKKLFNFTDDEKTPRLSFKRNEKQILKQYQDCLQEITLKEEILTDLRIEQSYQQQEVNEINNKIVQKKREILDPIVGLEMGKKDNKKNQNQMQQQSQQMIKSPNSTDENTDIFKFQNNNNNFIDLTDAKQFLRSNTKAIQYSMMSPLQQEFENEFQKYLNKGKIIKEAQEELRILEKEKEEKYSVLKAQMEKIQQIRYLGEEVRPEYFPDFIDDESIKYFTKIAEINQQINDKYDILKQIENQMKKKNQLRSKNPQEVKKSILKFNKDDIKQRLLSLQAGKIKAEIPESNLLYAKKSGQQLYLGELNEFYESQSKLIQLQAKTPSFNPFSEITKSVDEIELSISQKYKEIKKLQQEETQRIQKKFKDADEAFDEDEAINSCHKMLNIILGPKEGSREFFKYKQDLIAKKLRKQENETYYFSSTLNKNIKKKQVMQDDKSEQINTQFYNQVRKNKEIEILQKQTQKKMRAFQGSNDAYEVQNLDFKAAQNFLMEQLNSGQNYKSANNIKLLKYQEVDPNYIQDYDLKNNYQQDYKQQQGNQMQQNKNKILPKQLPNRFNPCQNTAFSETRSGLNSSQSICRPKTQQTYQRKKNVHFEEEQQGGSGNFQK
ncbi:hypothetical protein PPERSA_03850 [Pseudocohnilembus persalinus]|uniref:Uncharacterized protein n=1 Tax=Pseudocohnilembus persalinus TaxID=266149 RepID=A0A0V0QU40_PSEPJ|nr:hypothetical protein PPERSA_03850 [Pseudocohnilembus persalinus]|eukprot:KRX05913.1 hypothetical protein PPERSA_03850 [Pseudocohnilembus persalinus]